MDSKKHLENKKYCILTFGCQMNKSDSERIEGLLLYMGMKEAPRAEEADIVILNTCSVRQTAEDRVYGLIRNFNRLKKTKPHLLIAVTGCMAGRDKDGKIKKILQGNPPSNSPLDYKRGEAASGACTAKLREERSGVDFFFPISDLPRLPKLISSRWHKKTVGHLVSYSGLYGKKMDYLGVRPRVAEWWRGSVVIQTGCSNYCTYCVVPYARGHEKNRPMGAILKEAREMVKNGVREIQLLGQTVNSWQAPDPQNFSKNNSFTMSSSGLTRGSRKALDSRLRHSTMSSWPNGGNDRKSDFAALLWEINKIPGVNRIGFASAHPMYMTDAVIKALKLSKMMNYLHLPAQSGNDEILRKMNRKYTVRDYLKIIEKIKKVRPDISLATDIIVGFPGETKKQFADTVALYKKCDFDLSYTAMYSPRTGTAAFKAFPDDISREEKRRRWLILQKLMEKTALRKNKKFVGKIVEVLVDGCSGGKCYGFSREYKRVIFRGDKSLIGQIVNVKINKAKEWEMEGDMKN